MLAIPKSMASVLNVSHQVRAYAVVYQRKWPPDGYQGTPWAWVGNKLTPISPLPIESGTVTIDNSGAQRRRATLTLAPTPSALPTSTRSALTPYRNQVLLYYATAPMSAPLPPAAFAGLPSLGASSAIPASSVLMGIFTLTDVTPAVSATGDVTLSLDLQDLSQDISRRVLTAPYVTQNGILMTTAAQNLLNFAVAGGLPLPWFQADSTDALTSEGEGPDLLYAAGYTWDPGQDPWQAAMEIAESCGMQLFFNAVGSVEMRFIPNPATQPSVYTYKTGPGGNITSIKRPLSQTQVYNFVQVVCEGANINPSPDLLYQGTTFLAEIGDTDPTSPTYMYGPFGKSADVYYDMLNFQASTAMVAAKAKLRRDLGAADMVTLTALPNPAQDAYDRVTVIAPELGLHQDYIVDTIEIPLAPGRDMTLTGRRVVNVP